MVNLARLRISAAILRGELEGGDSLGSGDKVVRGLKRKEGVRGR